MNLISKLKAKLNNAPFLIKKHWPQFYAFYPDKLVNDKFKVITLLHEQGVGQLVDLFQLGNYVFRYKVLKTGYARGSDWGPYSNKEFDLQYHSKRKIKSQTVSPTGA